MRPEWIMIINYLQTVQIAVELLEQQIPMHRRKNTDRYVDMIEDRLKFISSALQHDVMNSRL